MGFIAKRFSFDRVPCEKFGLRIFDIDGNNNEATPFASTGSLQTDVIPSVGRVYLYGRAYDTPLEFTLVFGLDPCMIDDNDYLDRYDMDVIANWLTDHRTYKWLEIEQPDMEMVRYHCVISNLEPIQIAWIPWAFTATVTCDSPYGRKFPKTFTFDCTESANAITTITVNNSSTISRLYYPKLHIDKDAASTTAVGILNQTVFTTNDGMFKLGSSTDALPAEVVFDVDNELGIITSPTSGISNPYKYFNFNWLPLAKGKNTLKVIGKCTLTFTCEFPVNYGG